MAFDWQHYDLVLRDIGLSLALGAGVGALTPVPPSLAAAGFGVVGHLLIGHGLFVDGPVVAPADPTEPVDALN